MGEFSKEINATFKTEQLKAMLNLKYTSNFITTLNNKSIEPYCISNAQYNILRILRGAKKPIAMKLVKERMIEKSPNATRLVDKLCDKGLIKRIRCQNDRRVVYISMTSKGLDLLSKIRFVKGSEHMQNLTEKEALLLNSLLDKIRG